MPFSFSTDWGFRRNKLISLSDILGDAETQAAIRALFEDSAGGSVVFHGDLDQAAPVYWGPSYFQFASVEIAPGQYKLAGDVDPWAGPYLLGISDSDNNEWDKLEFEYDPDTGEAYSAQVDGLLQLEDISVRVLVEDAVQAAMDGSENLTLQMHVGTEAGTLTTYVWTLTGSALDTAVNEEQVPMVADEGNLDPSIPVAAGDLVWAVGWCAERDVLGCRFLLDVTTRYLVHTPPAEEL